MKFRSKQSALAWFKVATSLHSFLIGISFGALFSHWFDAMTVGLVALYLSFPFAFIMVKGEAKSRLVEAEDQLDALRYRGLYPPVGEGTDDDVKRLRDAGYKAQALRLHRELHGASPRETLDAFNAL